MNPFKDRFSDKKETPRNEHKIPKYLSTNDKKHSLTTDIDYDTEGQNERMNLLSENLRILSQKTQSKYQREEEREKRTTNPKRKSGVPKSPRTPIYSQQELLLTIEKLQKENDELKEVNSEKDNRIEELELKLIKLKQKLSIDRVKKKSQEFKSTKVSSFKGYFNNMERKERNSYPVKPKYYSSFHGNFKEPRASQRENGRLGGVFQTLDQLKTEIKNLKNQTKGDKNIDKLIQELRITRKKNEEMCERLTNFTSKGKMDNFNSKVNRLFYGSVSQNVRIIDEMRSEYEGLIEKMTELEGYCYKVKEENIQLRANVTGGPGNFSRSTANFRYYDGDGYHYEVDHGKED